ISEGLVGMIDFRIFIHGHNKEGLFKGKVIGFSNRLSSILVPQAFMDWSNEVYAPGDVHAPTRLIIDMSNPGDRQFMKYLDRKAIMMERADIFHALPGGIGTLDEVFTVAASATIGYHRKKVVLHNVKGFWDSLVLLLDDLQKHGMIRGNYHDFIEIKEP
ncbi:MAG: LOG family protein, partial [Prevotella denticola]